MQPYGDTTVDGLGDFFHESVICKTGLPFRAAPNGASCFFSNTKTISLPVVVTNLGHVWDFLELIYLDGHNSKEIKRKSTLSLHGFSSQVSTSLFSSTCYV
jgi:hypothetical protein